jgi:twinkle protein
MTDITAIKRMLAERGQAVAEMLLPGGRREGQEWRVGSVAGEKGQSLGVRLTGHKAGVWSDFGTGEEGGGLLNLWCAVKCIPLSEALKEAKAFLGIADAMPARAPKREFIRPKKPACEAVTGAALDYLTEDRNLSQEVVSRYRIAARAGHTRSRHRLCASGGGRRAHRRP